MGQTVSVSEGGELRLTPAQRQRWGVAPGVEFWAEETPDGVVLRRKDPVLRKVYVEPTAACNLSCRTCVRHSWDEPAGTMTMETYQRLMEGLYEVNSLRTVAFWGFGEPLMHPRIVEMVAMAKDLGATTEVVTNGLLLDERTARGLVDAGLDTLVVSLDGASPEAFADVRSGADLRLVRENVAGLRAIRGDNGHGPEIGISFVAMRRNVAELPHLRHLASTLGATFVVVSNVLPYTEELKDEILYGLWAGPSYHGRRSTWAPEIRLPRMDLRPDTAEPIVSLLRHDGLAPATPPQVGIAGGYCRFVSEGSAAVSWNGELSPCIALMHSYRCYVMRREKRIRRYSVGNVRERSIANIWQDDAYVAFRDRVRRFDFAPCTDCGGCDMAESNEEDCIGNTFPVCGDCLWAKGVIQCP